MTLQLALEIIVDCRKVLSVLIEKRNGSGGTFSVNGTNATMKNKIGKKKSALAADKSGNRNPVGGAGGGVNKSTTSSKPNANRNNKNGSSFFKYDANADVEEENKLLVFFENRFQFLLRTIIKRLSTLPADSKQFKT